MLDVERGVDVDPARQQLLDVPPTLVVPRSRRVAVRELIHQQQGWVACDGAVEVELLEPGAAVLQGPAGEDFEALDQAGGLRPPMGLHDADHHVESVGPLRLGRLQHAEGLADTGRRPEENLQLAAKLPIPLVLEPAEQGIGIGAGSGHDRKLRPACVPASRGKRVILSDAKEVMPAYGSFASLRMTVHAPVQRARPNESSARLSSNTFTRGSPRTPNCRPSV